MGARNIFITLPRGRPRPPAGEKTMEKTKGGRGGGESGCGADIVELWLVQFTDSSSFRLLVDVTVVMRRQVPTFLRF